MCLYKNKENYSSDLLISLWFQFLVCVLSVFDVCFLMWQ